MTPTFSPLEHQLRLHGVPVASTGTDRIPRFSPAHDTLVSSCPAGTAADVDAAVAAARQAFEHGPWPWTTGDARAAVFNRTAALLRGRQEQLALLETLETGKPITQSRYEIEWSAALWEYAAALARHLYGTSCNTLGPTKLAFTLKEPIGVVGIITPWNFPLLIVSQKLPFALAAGCTTVVKPSEFTPSTTILLADILAEAGLPPGALNVVTGYGQPVGQSLAEHADVDMITFTGSTRVGKSIVAASAGNLKKVALELGGKNPLLVFADADLDAALDAARLGAFFNMGECCNASSRILVQESIADQFVEKFAEAARAWPVGDPLDAGVKLGAIINESQEKKILDSIQAGLASGARLCLGGAKLPTPSGRFIQTTILDRVTPAMSVAREEIFGPVLSVLRFSTPDEAVAIANGTNYGLSAGLFTSSYETAVQVSRRLRAGTVWVNTWLDGHHELPFGGYRQSGLGRELGPEAVAEFTETKTLQFALGPRQPWW